jgi:hypothetical protein
MTTVTNHADQAAALLAAGFASEARRKEALDLLNRAYSRMRDGLLNVLIAEYPADADGVRAHPFEDLYWAVPMDLHLWKPRHADLLKDYPDACAQAAALTELRAAIKAAMVDPKPPRQDHPLLTFAKTANVDPAALRERRSGEYRDALDLGRKLGGLPASVHRVFCANYGGTTWVRLDWYLRGKRTPLSVIAAAYDQLVREGTIKEGAH